MPELQPRLVVGEQICSDPSLSGNREWLETNGVGGRYHGLPSGFSRASSDPSLRE
jgi:hypothetical protein